MNWKSYLTLLFGLVVGTCVIPFVELDENKETTPEPVIIQQTNSIPSYLERTNQTDRGTTNNKNLDWFKNTSDYVWDGWKIK